MARHGGPTQWEDGPMGTCNPDYADTEEAVVMPATSWWPQRRGFCWRSRTGTASEPTPLEPVSTVPASCGALLREEWPLLLVGSALTLEVGCTVVGAAWLAWARGIVGCLGLATLCLRCARHSLDWRSLLRQPAAIGFWLAFAIASAFVAPIADVLVSSAYQTLELVLVWTVNSHATRRRFLLAAVQTAALCALVVVHAALQRVETLSQFVLLVAHVAWSLHMTGLAWHSRPGASSDMFDAHAQGATNRKLPSLLPLLILVLATASMSSTAWALRSVGVLQTPLTGVAYCLTVGHAMLSLLAAWYLRRSVRHVLNYPLWALSLIAGCIVNSLATFSAVQAVDSLLVLFTIFLCVVQSQVLLTRRPVVDQLSFTAFCVLFVVVDALWHPLDVDSFGPLTQVAVWASVLKISLLSQLLCIPTFHRISTSSSVMYELVDLGKQCESVP